MEDAGAEDHEGLEGRVLLLELQNPPEVVGLVVGVVKDGRIDNGNVDVAFVHLGTAQRLGFLLSNPAAVGLIFGIPKFFREAVDLINGPGVGKSG